LASNGFSVTDRKTADDRPWYEEMCRYSPSLSAFVAMLFPECLWQLRDKCFDRFAENFC